ncbi:glycoside hydrolase [Mycena rebaudengoi]|nr:glycoside hydrolase [Mycena rebaudengoi]
MGWLAQLTGNKQLCGNNGTFSRSEIRLGTNGDSYHEYLLYITYAAGFLPSHDDDWRTSWKIQHKHEHLACFLAGSLMLGTVTTGATPNMRGSSNTQKTVSDGVALLEGCMETHKTSTGLSPEGVSFHDPMNEPGGDWYIEDSNQQWPSYYARYMLRPEIVESLFIVWRLTGDKRYRDYPWAVFSVTEKHCRQKEGGYATVMHVDGMPVVPLDKQETFVLSETLYLLTFSEGTLLPLKDIVFNTEVRFAIYWNFYLNVTLFADGYIGPLVSGVQASIKPRFTKYL